jgi:pyruvate dehydrogenase E1 component alpha subunit
MAASNAPPKLRLSRLHLHQLYRQMLRIRRFEAKCVELYQAQKIRGFLHLYDGEEAVAVGVTAALQPHDAVVSTYRDHGHALAHGVSMNSILAEMLGKLQGCCRGRGGSMHLFDRSRRFFGGNAIVGGGLPLAAGIALADQRLRQGSVTACFFGEGAVGEGVFHETLNLAALWKLPLLLVCENNLYAMGVPLADAEVETDIRRKAQAYRLPAEQVDGMDPVQMETAAQRAVQHIRAGGGPCFLEARTYRFRAHSMFDTQAYRTRDEVEGWKQHDPLLRLRAWMQANHELSAAEAEHIDADVAAEIEAAVRFAEAGTLEPVEELERFVLMDRVVQDEAAGEGI